MLNEEQLKILRLENKWPRPRIECNCGNYLSLCWGKTINPYLRHLPGKKLKCSNNKGETIIHKLAKEIIVKKLSNRGILNIRRECNNCHSIFDNVLEEANSYKIEYKLIDNKVADIAALDENDNIIYLLEIFHTHKTSDDKREGYHWFEIKAEDILKYYDDKKDPLQWDLNECRLTLFLCDNCKNNLDTKLKIYHVDVNEIDNNTERVDCSFNNPYPVLDETETFSFNILNNDKTYISHKNDSLLKDTFKQITNDDLCNLDLNVEIHDYILKFGKHKGCTLSDVPFDYLIFLAGYNKPRYKNDPVNRLEHIVNLVWDYKDDANNCCHDKKINLSNKGVHSSDCYGICLGSNKYKTRQNIIEKIYYKKATFYETEDISPWIWVYKNHKDIVLESKKIIKQSKKCLLCENILNEPEKEWALIHTGCWKKLDD